MYIVLFKLYRGDPTVDNVKGVAGCPNSYSSLSSLRRMLRRDFGIFAKHREKEAVNDILTDQNIVESYYIPEHRDGLSARFYVIECDLPVKVTLNYKDKEDA